MAATTISAGERLTAADFRTQPMLLPHSLSRRYTFDNTSALRGTVAAVPLRPGELVQVGDVISGPAGIGRVVSFPVDPARALNGALSYGDRVDVLATYGSGSSATTSAVVRSAKVLAVSGSSGGVLASGGSMVVTLSVDSPASLLALAQAVNAAQVLLVRTTGDSPTAYPAAQGAPAAVSSPSPPSAQTIQTGSGASFLPSLPPPSPSQPSPSSPSPSSSSPSQPRRSSSTAKG
ncbi:MAG: hypothetical protein M0Z87_00225 [Actinomycetota bacterium]|nr:hypothetical protein [Actinomycetota bacterium]